MIRGLASWYDTPVMEKFDGHRKKERTLEEKSLGELVREIRLREVVRIASESSGDTSRE